MHSVPSYTQVELVLFSSCVIITILMKADDVAGLEAHLKDEELSISVRKVSKLINKQTEAKPRSNIP